MTFKNEEEKKEAINTLMRVLYDLELVNDMLDRVEIFDEDFKQWKTWVDKMMNATHKKVSKFRKVEVEE